MTERRMPEPDEPCQSPESPPDTRPQRAKSSHKQNARKAQKRRSEQPMTEQLKPGWRWENFDYLRSTVVTAPNGMEYELRAGDIAHPRAQRLFDAMFAALTTSQPAQAGADEVFLPRRLAATHKLTQLGYRYDHMQGQWLPTQPAAQATHEPVKFSHAGHFYNLVGHALMEVKRPDACAHRLRLILDELAALMGQPATPEPVGEPDAPLFTRPAPGVPEVDDLAQFIRQIDGKHSMGAGVLAEHICDWLAAAQAKAVDPEDLAAAGVMLMGRRADHD